MPTPSYIGLIVEESNQHITIILSYGAPHIARPLREGRGVLDGALAKRAQNLANFVPIDFQFPDRTVVKKPKFDHDLARTLRESQAIQQVVPPLLDDGDQR